MKKSNITFLLTMLMSMVGINTSAHDIAVKNADGVTIYYNYINNSTELAVTYRGSSSSDYSNEYTGNVVIPKSVTYNEKTYSVTSIGELAFYRCSGLTSITIPNSVTSIGFDAFKYCTGLTSITIPFGVTSIDEEVFEGCSGLISITIHPNITNIGKESFKGCTGLTSITIPNSVTNITPTAFSGCFGLTSITVEKGNTKYDSREDCNAIIETATNTLVTGCKNTVIPNSVTTIGYRAFTGHSELTSIIIPNNVTSIGDNVFSGCSGLTSITIPNSVTSIGNDAFSSCNKLTSITIPNSVTSIGNYAFYHCSGLTSVYSYIENPTSSTGSNFESSHYTNATLYVPYGTKDKYLATDGWKNFANIVEMSETAVKEVSASNTNEAKYYSLDGKQFSQPQKGLNILKMSDGTTRKVMK